MAQRVLVAIIGAPLLLALAYAGGWPFVAGVSLLAAVGWHELAGMLAMREIRVSHGIGLPAIVAFIVIAGFGLPALSQALVAATVVAALAWVVMSGGKFSFSDAAATVFGALYAGFLFGFMVLLRERSFAIVALVLAVTWAADSMAYFTGLAFGKHKLAPRISPGKSVEGAVGGVVGALLVGAAGGPLAGLSVGTGVLLGALAGTAGPIGDLAESGIKRWCGVKDSGTILPGHGGVLDRFDSLLFVAPCVYYLLTLIH